MRSLRRHGRVHFLYRAQYLQGQPAGGHGAQRRCGPRSRTSYCSWGPDVLRAPRVYPRHLLQRTPVPRAPVCGEGLTIENPRKIRQTLPQGDRDTPPPPRGLHRRWRGPLGALSSAGRERLQGPAGMPGRTIPSDIILPFGRRGSLGRAHGLSGIVQPAFCCISQLIPSLQRNPLVRASNVTSDTLERTSTGVARSRWSGHPMGEAEGSRPSRYLPTSLVALEEWAVPQRPGFGPALPESSVPWRHADGDAGRRTKTADHTQ
ncbi:hypothetical protein BJQ89_02751 [Arthrobacter sp. ES1]|nr:hypothetical protein [Arthrobacter sp. ES1]